MCVAIPMVNVSMPLYCSCTDTPEHTLSLFDIPLSSRVGISADAPAVHMVGTAAAAAECVCECGVDERGVLEAASAAGGGAGDVVGALLVQVQAQVLQLAVLPQEVALPGSVLHFSLVIHLHGTMGITSSLLMQFDAK